MVFCFCCSEHGHRTRRSHAQSIHYDATKAKMIIETAALKEKQLLEQQKMQLEELERSKREVSTSGVLRKW